MNNAQLRTKTPNNVADSQPALDLNDQWVKDTRVKENEWRKNRHSKESGYISQYGDSNDFYWQCNRHGHLLSGHITGLDEAMRKAEECLALPIEEFNDLVATKLLNQLEDLERQILAIKPAQKLLPGYCAGYEDGMAETKAKIAKVLDMNVDAQ